MGAHCDLLAYLLYGVRRGSAGLSEGRRSVERLDATVCDHVVEKIRLNMFRKALSEENLAFECQALTNSFQN